MRKESHFTDPNKVTLCSNHAAVDPLQSLESGEVLLPRSRIIHLVQENNFDM